MDKESFPVELRGKYVSGRSQNRLSSWNHLSRNIEAEFGRSKSVKTTRRQLVPVVTDLALFGTSRADTDCFVSLRQLPSSRPF